MNTYTSDQTSPRSFRWLWFLRIAAIVITLVVLGITASNSSDFNSIGCSVPGKLGFNLAVAIISLICLVYFILATRPNTAFKTFPWFIWGHLALDALLFILWFATAASSSYSCDDLCNACNGFDFVTYDSQACTCYYVYKRDTSPAPKGLLETRRNRNNSTARKGGSVAAKQAFDAIMTIIFAVCLASTVYWTVKYRRSSSSTTSTPTNPTIKHEEAGIAAGTTAAPSYQSEPAYGNQTNAPGGYSMHQQQDGYPTQQQAMPQNQYFQQTYPPSQSVPPQSVSPVQPQHMGSMPPQQASYPPPAGMSEMHSPPHSGPSMAP